MKQQETDTMEEEKMKKRAKKIVALFFLAIFASGIVMGMSPTVFASGERVFFLSYLLLILVQAFLLKNVISYEYNNEKI